MIKTNKSKCTHYVVFTPAELAGIYTDWKKYELLVKQTCGATYLGFWSLKQAEIAFTKDYEEAKLFRLRVIERGENKPTPHIDPQKYIMKW